LFTQATRCGPKVQVLSGNVAIVLKTDWLPSWASSVCHPKAVEATVMRKIPAGFRWFSTVLYCFSHSTGAKKQHSASACLAAPLICATSSTCRGRSGSHPSLGAEVLHTESPQLHARWKWNNVGNRAGL